MTLPCTKVIKMAAFKRNFSYLLTNFSNTFANEALNFSKTRRALFHCSTLLCVKGREIKMPSLSPTMTEGKIVKWLKKEGDPITPGDVLCDIETDKAIVSMELEEEGILGKILVPENSANIKIGSLIALMVDEGEDWKNLEIPDEGPPKTSTSTIDVGAVTEGQPVISEASAMPIKMPSLSPTMTEGTIVKWLKKEGDTVAPGDVLCDIQTDKAILSLEAEEEGVLAKILAPDDSKNVKVGTLIAVIVPEDVDWKSVVVNLQPLKSTTEKEEVVSSQFSVGGTAGVSEVGGKKFGPAVKALLSLYQLQPGLIKPTGRGNRLLKEDVLKYIADNNSEKKPPKAESALSAAAKPTQTKPESVHKKKPKIAPISTPKFRDIELSDLRLTIAKKLVQSKQEIPHFYSTAKCNVGSLMALQTLFHEEGIEISLNDLLTKAVALALQMYPKANALCINNEVKLAANIDLCVAGTTDTSLLTPVIKNANQKSIVNISKEIKEFSEKAKTGKLKPMDYEGGTFTISNLGMFGITHFKAIINPPQGAILAIGRTIEGLSPELKIVKHLTVNLSCDARVLQDHEATEFLEVLKYFIENPNLLISDVKESLSMSL